MAGPRRAGQDDSSQRGDEPVRMGSALRRSNTNPGRILFRYRPQRPARIARRLSGETDCRWEVTDRAAAFGYRSANEGKRSGGAKTVHFSDAGKRSDFTAASGR